MSQRLDWPDGDATDRTVSIPLLDDNLIEPTEAFLVEISGVTEGFVVLTRRVPIIIDSNEKPAANPPPADPGHGSRSGSGHTGLTTLLLLIMAALQRFGPVAVAYRKILSARSGA